MLSNPNKIQLMNEVLDPRKVRLICKDHSYLGEGPPHVGCAGCWKVYYVAMFQKIPPNERAERAEELLTIVHHMLEDLNNNKFDMELYPFPKIKIEKDVN